MDGASFAALRVVVGLVAVVSALRTLANGWVAALYAGPAARFTYPGFAWVPDPGERATTALVVAVGISGALVAAGRWYRPAVSVLLVTFTWIELLDATTYLNHYWLMTLLSAILVVAPRTTLRAPSTVALGWIWLLRAQIATVYIFAGIAKMHADWLLHAQPLRLWLAARSDVPLVGPVVGQPATAFVLSWAGLAFDCTIVGFLLWRRTRLVAWLAVVAFHVATWVLFEIGVFPWLMIGATTMFFAPGWPRRFLSTPALGRDRPRLVVDAAPMRLMPWLAVVWMVVQVALPLRHLAINGDARWTGEGYRWSWNVLAAEKGGAVTFRVTDPTTGRTWLERPSALYSPLQVKAMSTEPELIRQAAHEIARRDRTDADVEVRADAFVSLNGRPAWRLIDPDVDLAAEPVRLGHQPWILAAPPGAPP